MAKQVVDVGSKANDGSGDSLREAGIKINANFTEIYTALGGVSGNVSVVSKLTGANGLIVSNPTGDITLTNRIATPTQLGVVKVGNNLSINSEGVLSANAGAYTLPTATGSVLGGIKVGSGLSISNGVLSADAQSTQASQLVNGSYTVSLGSNGVLTLPDGSIINGSTIRGVAGTEELNYTGITIGPNNNDAEKTWMWVDHANAYISTNNFANTWTFNNSGALTFPQGTTIATADGTDAFIIDGAVDKDIQIYTYSGPTPTAHGWTFGANGALENLGSWTKTTTNSFNGGVASQVVWTSTEDFISGAKLLIQLECDETGGVNTWETQMCEAIIAVQGHDDTSIPVMSVYGVTHTSAAPLMTFTVDRDPVTKLIEVTGTRTETARLSGVADLRIYSVETGTMD